MTTTFDVNRLAGTHVRLWPYARGWYPRDILYRCWLVMERDGATARVFHSSVSPPDIPYSQQGDLTEFVTLLADPRRVVLIVQAAATDDILGLIWFDDLIPQHRALCNIFMCKAAYGPAAEEASTLAAAYAFEHLQVPTLWAFTPWPVAVAHAKSIGFQVLAQLPGLVPGGMPMCALKMERRSGDGDDQ